MYQTDAFLSYTRLDDDFFGGAITSFRAFLELGVRVVTGNKDFNIFQDIDGIEFGQQWQVQLDQAIKTTRFLIPIITPLFFQSSACRDELTKFIKHEADLGRNDLILPLYFVTTPVLEKKELLNEDALALQVSARQRYDWRSKADLPINDPQTRTAVKDLAQKIAEAISRTTNASPPPHSASKIKLDEEPREAAFKRASETIIDTYKSLHSRRQRKILWVDDRPDNNIFERQAMEAYSIEFELAESTGDALAKLWKARFDAIISDMGRPPDGRAGYTLLDALRRSGDLTPYFIYAGSDSEEHRREALSKGAQGSTNRSDKLIKNVLNSLDS